jgi:outer membrane protein OmpU
MNNTFKLAAVSSAALMLAAAPAMAEGPTLKLGGYYDQKMSIQDQDSLAAVQSDVDVRNDVEIYFIGEVTLDNGIKIGTRVELEGGTNGSATPDGGNLVNGGDNNFDQIDEAFMTITGSFGSVKMGMSDTAAKSMTTGLQATWNSNVGENLSFNARKLFRTPTSGVTLRGTPAAQMDLNSDGEQISYTTPSFGGFQVAVGYAQNSFETFDGVTTSTTVDGDIFDIGARYVGKVGDVSFRVGGGYAIANDQTVGAEDDAQWMLGGSVRFGAFQLAASFSRQEETRIAGAADVAGVDTIELGARAWMGPNEFSLVYTQAEADSVSTTVNGDEETVVALAMRRTLGKGVSWHNTLYWYDAEDGNPAATGFKSNDGLAFTTGIQVRF